MQQEQKRPEVRFNFPRTFLCIGPEGRIAFESVWPDGRTEVIDLGRGKK